ncbi:uncharacterized protein LOC101863840 [Aplysia californica]|uniref:Uncharacterized protein LOC101863840 n=1 Tax=Aplysia californica TaxID=6500 RepID=A0ABM0K1N4_APLCA|nr:uncharacterized protein LOC101863840 [Aplysia californica]
MKVLAIFAVFLAVVYGAPSADKDKVDPFISLVQEIEGSTFFPTLDLDDRLLTFEMLSAAETTNLKPLLDKLGYIVLLEYIDALPEDYQHRFVRYSVEHLQNEYPIVPGS